MIPIAVCSVARPQPYLYATMASLLASDFNGPIHVCVGGPDHAYAKPHAGRRVTIHPLTAAEWDGIMAIRNRLVKDQNAYATIRCLAQHIGYTSTGLAGHMHRAADFHVPWPSGDTP